MKTTTRFVCGVLLSCAAFTAGAAELSYPARPLRIIDPFPPGGVSDTVARMLGQRLGESLGQSVVIDNRAGAGGVVGSEIASRAAPDGHTMLLAGLGPLAVAPSLIAKLPYDPQRDFQPITQLTSGPLLIVVNPSLPAKSLKDLIALARAKPGQLNFASGGTGTSNHLAAEMLKLAAGIDIVHVPYKGAAPALTNVIAGEAQIMTANIVPAIPLIKAGKLRGLAVTSARRSGVMPEVPTVAESGLPGFEASAWHGMLVPARTPQPVVARLHRELLAILNQAEFRERLTSLGLDVAGTTPQAFAAWIRSEAIKYAKVVKEAGVRME